MKSVGTARSPTFCVDCQGTSEQTLLQLSICWTHLPNICPARTPGHNTRPPPPPPPRYWPLIGQPGGHGPLIGPGKRHSRLCCNKGRHGDSSVGHRTTGPTPPSPAMSLIIVIFYLDRQTRRISSNDTIKLTRFWHRPRLAICPYLWPGLVNNICINMLLSFPLTSQGGYWVRVRIWNI